MKVESDSNSENVGDLAKTIPKDAHVMASILRDMGINDWEPRVINQLLEFSYNYVTNVLDDAKTLSTHAKKKNVDVEDVRLAVQMYTDKNVTTPPPRDVLLEVARTKNITTLPIPKPTCGLRLPPDRFCLTSCNYKLKTNRKHPGPRPGPYHYGHASSANNSMALKNKVMMGPPTHGPQLVGPNVQGAAPSLGLSPNVPSFTMTPQGIVPNQLRPMVKTTGPPLGIQPTPYPPTNKIQINPASVGPMFTMTINPTGNSTLKRKADDVI